MSRGGAIVRLPLLCQLVGDIPKPQDLRWERRAAPVGDRLNIQLYV